MNDLATDEMLEMYRKCGWSYDEAMWWMNRAESVEKFRADVAYTAGIYDRLGGGSKIANKNYHSNSRLFTADERNNMVYAPAVDFSHLTRQCIGIFQDCTNLVCTPPYSFGVTIYRQYSDMFTSCAKLQRVGTITFSENANLERFFMKAGNAQFSFHFPEGCGISGASMMFMRSTMKIVPPLPTSKCANFEAIFSQSLVERIEELDLQRASNVSNLITGNTVLYALLKNIGTSALLSYPLNGSSKWGTGSTANRRSLIDSLITYSYDRAAAEMEPATIQLHSTVKALLTDEEKAQIAAKGFSLA